MVWNIASLRCVMAVDLDDMALGALAVILREFAERPFQLAYLRQQAALHHDLRLGRHAQFAGDAFHHRQRRAVQRAGDRKLVEVDRRDRLRRQQRQRIDADDDGDIERLPAALGHLIEHMRMARQQQRAQPVGAAQLQAVQRHVLHTGRRIARDAQPGVI